MGAASSRLDDDKSLMLCRERRHYVRQALEGRCLLAAAHVSYIQALRNTGMALLKLVEPESPVISSLYTSTSTSGTPYPLTMTEKSASQFSNQSPLTSRHVDTIESFSPTPSSPGSGRFHMSYMKSNSNVAATVEERPPMLVKATLQPSPNSSPKTPHVYEHSDYDITPPPPGTPPWDYFGLFHPIDNHLSLQDGRAMNHISDCTDDIREPRQEEDIPNLEEEEERDKIEHLESEDEFDQPSSEPLVRIFKNRTEMEDLQSTESSADMSSGKLMNLETAQHVEESATSDGVSQHNEAPELSPKSSPPVATFPVSAKPECEKEFVTTKIGAKDFSSIMKDIENLFIKASESGKEVPRMLEANKVNFRPLHSEDQVLKSKRPSLFSPFFACGRDGAYDTLEPSRNEIKCLTWHLSASSLSSSSYTAQQNGIGDTSSEPFSSVCMNSGSHASTLDRLYAWERKLYDEVKASGIVRKEYDLKCKLLRQLDSKSKILDLKEDSSNKIAQTRSKVKDLHSRIRVAIQRINSISKTIEELRDKELQPQLEELIGGLLRMWETMLECHRSQTSIMSDSTSGGGLRISMHSESNRQAAEILIYELNYLYSSFTKWISAHKSYLQSIYQWLLKCVNIDLIKQKSTRRRNIELSPRRDIAPPIYITCKDWLERLNKLPSKEVADAVKQLAVETSHLVPREEKSHGSVNLSFSLSRRVQSGELTEKNDAPLNWSVGFGGFQQSLEVFLEQLKAFSENSVLMYGELGNNIINARNHYDAAGKRM